MVHCRTLILFHVFHLSSPCEWYRGYGHLRHLLNPIYFATSGTSPKIKNSSRTSSETTTTMNVTSKPIIEPFTFPDRDKARILILGCGNSTFGADMLRDGWTGPIVGVDYSHTVIHQMQHKYGSHFYQHNKGNLKFVCADITKPLDFEDGAFDLIVCKGTLDAVLCASKGDAVTVVRECHRLLAPGHGIFFLVTNGNPDSRLEYLEYENSLTHYWRGVSVQVVPKQYQEEK